MCSNERPANAGATAVPELIARFAGFGDWVAAQAVHIPAAHRNWKPDDAEFGWTGQLCHLRDIEREGYMIRIARVVDEDCPRLVGIDGSVLAADRNYPGQDAERALVSFLALRAANAAALRALSLQDFGRSCRFGDGAPMTLFDLVDRMIGHDDEHRGQIEALIAEGRARSVFV
jgi:DinB superfamily